METIFKKIHEGLDLFNYYFTRHEASNNDSQREKLESDLKKEIKKLQKFRDQIKTWQGNDSLEATIAPQKLQEHRRLVEEAMECYKEVEKNSKMKSFSNQSIMLAAKDSGDLIITPEVEDALEFLSGVEEELNEQNETLDEEYEKLSQKKVRKNNMLQIEERKQELESFKAKNEFHLENIEAVVRYLKSGKVSVESVWTIQDDLNFYVESNQEPDFVDDDTLYDEIFKEAKQNSENNTLVSNGHPDESFDISMNGLEDTETTQSASEPATKRKGTSSASPAPLQEVTPPSEIPSKPTTNLTVKSKQTVGKSEADNSTPGFVTTLKPAAAPPKPAGALKWSIAAGGAAPKPEGSNGHIATEKSGAKQPGSLETEKRTPVPKKEYRPEEHASSELLSLLTKNEEYSPHLEVLKNSSLAPCEMELFSDLNLLRAPPGIQEFAVGYTATNRASSKCKLLVGGQNNSSISSFMHKTYLPRDYQEGLGLHQARLPMFLSKLQNYWNRIRASNLFNQLIKEVELLEHQKTTESAAMVNELTMVLFYGYYCGYMPLENIIAEFLLHKLGWAPYGMDDAAMNAESLGQYQYWFLQVGTSGVPEAGDFRVFDLSQWEIYVKYGFKFDPRLSKSGPAKSLFWRLVFSIYDSLIPMFTYIARLPHVTSKNSHIGFDIEFTA